jgi:hypothetical protein
MLFEIGHARPLRKKWPDRFDPIGKIGYTAERVRHVVELASAAPGWQLRHVLTTTAI